MQEEVEQRVVTLIVNCSKLTEQELRKALGKLLTHLKTQHQTKQPHGKMTVKKLAAQNRAYRAWRSQTRISVPSTALPGSMALTLPPSRQRDRIAT